MQNCFQLSSHSIIGWQNLIPLKYHLKNGSCTNRRKTDSLQTFEVSVHTAASRAGQWTFLYALCQATLLFTCWHHRKLLLRRQVICTAHFYTQDVDQCLCPVKSPKDKRSKRFSCFSQHIYSSSLIFRSTASPKDPKNINIISCTTLKNSVVVGCAIAEKMEKILDEMRCKR